jgi:Mob1/phocein family
MHPHKPAQPHTHTLSLSRVPCSIFHLYSDKNKTFRPKKSIPRGTKQYEMHKHAKATLGSGNLKAAVALPPKEDVNEWLAVNSMYFTEEMVEGFFFLLENSKAHACFVSSLCVLPSCLFLLAVVMCVVVGVFFLLLLLLLFGVLFLR